MTTVELRQKRAALVKEARKLLETVKKEEREFTAEENEKYERMMADVDKMKVDIDRLEKQETLEREIEEPENRAATLETATAPQNENKEELRKSVFRKWLALDSRLNEKEKVEYRAMQADSPEGGGYLIAPQEFVAELLKDVDDQTFVRQLCRVFSLTKSESLGVPQLDSDFSDADWTIELAVGSEDELKFGKRELRPHPIAKWTTVSKKLIRISALNIEQIIRERLAYKFAVTFEKAMMTGDGVQKPLGLFTESSDGISSSRDVQGNNKPDLIMCDALIDTKYSLKEAYLRNAVWLFHRDAVKQIRKLKDGQGQYIWQPGIQSGNPDRILDLPYRMSEYVPNTFEAGKYVGIVGDFRNYWIAEALNMEVQRLIELWAATNQVGYIARMEFDGAPVREEAFARVKLGS
jgi:HK97 family phage major capsid protein